MDADFFSQLRACDVAQSDAGQRLLKFIEEEFGDLDLSMEAFYSQVHLHDQFVADLPRGKGRRRRYEWARRYFLRVIQPIFEATVGDLRCKWHDALVGALAPGDALISFNYDCLIDRSLRDVGKRKWDAGSGYGVTAGGDVDAWRDHAGTGRPPVKRLQLLKLHGSLNWEVDANGGLSLLTNEYMPRSEDDLCIVPPLWQKSFDDAPFHDIWLAARERLTTTKALLVIGYSLPVTDVYTQALMRIDVQDLDFLLIANPDPSARSRIRRAVRSALSTSTRIVELDDFAAVARLLEPTASAPTAHDSALVASMFF
jgi:hypothetical protein